VNVWLWVATGLVAALGPLVVAMVRRPAIDGVVVLELAGTLTAVALLLIAQGTGREPFADLALVFAVLSFAGIIGYLRFLERER
jgi:multicomponent Na+:H+ antiporter subunit F